MNCKACEKELPVNEWNKDTSYQFDNALWIGFFGGYGMFVDDIDTEFGYNKPTLSGAAYEAVLCHECAHELCETVPWIGKLLRPLESHSHTLDFWQDNPDHEGWDKDSALENLHSSLQKAKENYPHE